MAFQSSPESDRPNPRAWPSLRAYGRQSGPTRWAGSVWNRMLWHLHDCTAMVRDALQTNAGRPGQIRIIQSQMETHLGSRVPRIVLREEDFTESSFPEKFVRNPHLILGDLDLVKLASPPCPANFRQSLRLGLGDRSLGIDQSKRRHVGCGWMAEQRLELLRTPIYPNRGSWKNF